MGQDDRTRIGDACGVDAFVFLFLLLLDRFLFLRFYHDIY